MLSIGLLCRNMSNITQRGRKIFCFPIFETYFFFKIDPKRIFILQKSPRHLEIYGPIKNMQKIGKIFLALKIAKKWSKNDFKAKKKKKISLERKKILPIFETHFFQNWPISGSIRVKVTPSVAHCGAVYRIGGLGTRIIKRAVISVETGSNTYQMLFLLFSIIV